MALIECGEEAAKHFAFAKGYRNLNHGSYGTYPIEIRDVFRDYQSKTEARPDAFVRYEYRTKLLDESREAIAKYLNVPTDTCVYVPNATTAIETVLRNLVYKEGDVIVYFATVYPAFANTAKWLAETTRVQVHSIDYTLPVSDKYICDAFETTIRELKAAGKNPRIAIFDAINSLPSARMPFEELVKLCKTHRLLSCVDGAHAIGHIPLDLPALDPDFFVTNCHKWLYVPRSCAVFHVPLRNQHLLRTTLPTSFMFGSPFVANFSSVGTLDDNPYLCVPAALEWRKRLSWGDLRGDEAAMGYMRKLARAGGKMVAGILQTEILENEEETLGNCNLVMVRLPLVLLPGKDAAAATKMSDWVMKVAMLEENVAVYTTFYAGSVWARLSAQIYLTLADFGYAGRALQRVCERAQRGEWA
ncbi:aminotransferase family [Lecanosticta acicola]|uniref:Aminotransferase family n=1 Tax=Lecanosticta acicola TaxID=111012 RepID=A0AAI8Z2E2_9PEZI|nr:aminotransferase family [Lecanosticta acicola]